MTKYPIKEIFLSLQGEGKNAGMPAWFLRLAGCNVGCDFCDEKEAWTTEKAEWMTPEEILDYIELFCEGNKVRNIIVTGGEPSLYDMEDLCQYAHKNAYKCYLETSGVNPITGQWDWICLSPKQKKLPLKGSLLMANELKVVIEQDDDFLFAEKMRALTNNDCRLFLQAQWFKKEDILPAIQEYIFQNPLWNLSTQTHKYLNIR